MEPRSSRCSSAWPAGKSAVSPQTRSNPEDAGASPSTGGLGALRGPRTRRANSRGGPAWRGRLRALGGLGGPSRPSDTPREFEGRPGWAGPPTSVGGLGGPFEALGHAPRIRGAAQLGWAVSERWGAWGALRGPPSIQTRTSRATPRTSISYSSPITGGRLGNQRTPWIAAAPAGARTVSARKLSMDCAV